MHNLNVYLAAILLLNLFVAMLRNTLFQIHWFLGITAGFILSIMGVTGAIYSYEPQILKWLNQDSYIVAAPDSEKLTPEQLYQRFSQQHPDAQINSISIAKEANASSSINIAKEGERRGYNIMLNPYTAEVLPEIKGKEFFHFIEQLHRNLTVGKVGKQITGACVLMLFFFVLSGLYLRWPKKHSLRQWFAIKPKLKGRNFLWDLHAVVGTWVILFYLIFATTGLYWSYDWWRNGLFKVLGVENSQAMRAGPQGKPNSNEKPNHPQQGSNSGRNNERASSAQAGALDSQPTLSAEKISLALSSTWTGFTQQLNRDYSSITLNLPKKEDGKIDISFVDNPPQHERARNQASYNYQTQRIETIELYQDKKLNKKIMSSMLPVHRGSFIGPVYQFFAMLAALAMPLFFITGWLLYLKRREQKKLTRDAKYTANMQHLAPSTQSWTILYASQTGTAEQIAYQTATALQRGGIASQVKALKDYSIEELQELKQVLFIVSTYGTGDAPDLVAHFVKKSMAQTAALDNMHYAILALGSKEYPETYCYFGHALNRWLQNSNAKAVFNLVEVDNANKQDLEYWYTALTNISQQDIAVPVLEKSFNQARLISRTLLNANSLGEPVFEVLLQPSTNEVWQAGDIVEIQPGNSKQRFAQFIAQHQLEDNSDVYDALRYKDLTQAISSTSDLAQILSQLEQLPLREYSIASIVDEGIIRLVIRQKQCTSDLGLGSGWLTQYVQPEIPLAIHIRHNPAFQLVEGDHPAIFIGNGTGIAGLLSLLKQREQLGLQHNWLIFGERQQSIDYFYQTQIETWQQQGHLQSVDLAFSRDQEQRIYVQHKLLEQWDQIRSWVEQGAVIYICGSMAGMAQDVEQALIDILGEEGLNQLREQQRYRRDVY